MSEPSSVKNLQWVAHMLRASDVNRAAFLESEIHHRERDRVLYGVSRQLVRSQIWATIRLVLLTMVTVFVLTWTVGQVGQFIAWARGIWTRTFALPPALRALAPVDLASLFPSPTSTLAVWSADIPLWTTQDASLIALLATLLVLVWRIHLTYQTWKQDRVLHQAITEIEEELVILRQWQSKLPQEISET